MKRPIHLNKYLLLCCCWLLSSAHAAPGDPVEISADKVEFQEESGISVYEGNAKLTQGKDRINAHKIVIVHPEQEIESIRITGNGKKPASLRLHLKGGKIVEGQAQHISYDLASEILEMRTAVHLKQGKNSITADTLTYDKRNQAISAQSLPKRRVVTTFEAPRTR